MPVYSGLYIRDEISAVTVDDRLLSPRHDLARHADNLGWRDATGALQLALAILAHHCGGDVQRALAFHEAYCHCVVIYLPSVWLLESEEVEATLLALETLGGARLMDAEACLALVSSG